MRSTLGISQKHSRNTSGAHAIRCCSVPRFSCAKADDPTNSSAAIASGCHAPARRISGNLAIFEWTSIIGALPSCPIEPPRCQRYTGLWRTDGFGPLRRFALVNESTPRRPTLRAESKLTGPIILFPGRHRRETGTQACSSWSSPTSTRSSKSSSSSSGTRACAEFQRVTVISQRAGGCQEQGTVSGRSGSRHHAPSPSSLRQTPGFGDVLSDLACALIISQLSH